MTRSVPLTYAGALTLLEGRSGRIAKLMDRLVGTGILLGAVVFPPAVALVDVRQEISRSLGDLLEASAAKMRGECGRSRLDYVAAAHTTLVLASLFDAFSAEMGSRFAAMHVTDEEKLRLATSPGRLANDRIASGGHIVTQQEWIDAVLAVDVPLPSAVRGFEENLREELIPRVTALSASALSFLGGLAAWQDLPRASRLRPSQVVSCWESFYRERFVRLAADIPEFFIWTALGEHGATRLQLSRLDNHLTAALEAQSETLGKLHDLLASGIAYPRPTRRSVRTRLAVAAASVLGKPLLRSANLPGGLVLPTVTEGFVTPRFRYAVAGAETQPSREAWWNEQRVHDSLDEFLAVHLAHPDSARWPTIILGHPGAGKSLLTDVLAARLPDRRFTVVPVQLRRVDADARIPDQIDSALRSLLHEHVTWGQLAEESSSLQRVVILDGFDELIQATGTSQTHYLAEVMRFQEQEYDLGRAVSVIVTSRTVVADRARIPDGSLLVKLESFSESEIGRWVSAWNAANRHTPGYQRLDAAKLARYGELARQPLLLTMLAIYACDPDARPWETENLTDASLYQRILDTFIRRQVMDKPERPPTVEAAAREVLEHRWRLSVAAFGMFNRGQQYVSEADLDRDLRDLSPDDTVRTATPGFAPTMTWARRTIASFFFIHVDRAEDHRVDARQSYEFLHATFGEFLLAERSLRLLDGYATRLTLFREDPSAHEPPDDGLLQALLSHDALISRKPIVDFFQQLAAACEPRQRSRLAEAAVHLLSTCRTKMSSGYLHYRPTGPDAVYALAHYSANLFTLAAVASDEPAVVSGAPASAADPIRWAASTVGLWWSCLNYGAYGRLVDLATAMSTHSGEQFDPTAERRDHLDWWLREFVRAFGETPPT